MFLKPTDLGPLYKEPILAQVYTPVMENPKDYIGVHTLIEDRPIDLYPTDFGALAMNTYLHNKLQQVNKEAEVKTITPINLIP